MTVVELTIPKKLILAATLALLSVYAAAQSGSGLSIEQLDSRTLSIQRKVDRLFDRGEFERAYFIYRNELAPLGDKYAQYMVGFMHVTGMGVEEDVVIGSAWYRLAAERETPEFLKVRDRLMRVFSEEQQRRSDALFAELRFEFSDLAVMIASIKNDVRELQSRTGSRVRGDTSPVAVISGRNGSVRSGASYFGDIERRVETQLQTLSEYEGFDGIDTDPKSVSVLDLERRARRYMQSH